MPTTILPIHPGDQLELKKQHPCGSSLFKVIRVGKDVRVICLGCGRDMDIDRIKLERAVRRILPVDEAN